MSMGCTTMGASSGKKAEFDSVMRLVWRGQIRGIISQTFPLEAAAEAHMTMEGRKVFGKLVLRIP